MSISQQIKVLRKEAGLTQVQLADRSGVGLRFLKELERGKPTVRLDKINQILIFFRCRLEVVREKPGEF